MRVVNNIYGRRNDAGGSPATAGDATHCGLQGYVACWTWTGSTHLDVTRIHVGLTLTRTPESAVNSYVTFSAGMEQEYFPGNPNPVDMSGLEFKWVPDRLGSADTVSCRSRIGRTCTRELVEPGTMHVGAYVNGEWQGDKMLRVQVDDPCHTGLPFSR